MRRTALLSACVVVLAFGVSCRERPAQAVDPGAAEATGAAARELKVGDPAPDFSLPGSDGITHTLSSHKGRQVVVLAWFAKAFTSA
jgi:peroxiredoxin Q/BCP